MTVVISPPDMNVVTPRLTASIVVSRAGQQGPPGESLADSVSLQMRWGTPTTETNNTITVPVTVENLDNTSNTTSPADVEIRVTDSATDNEPSHTAVLSAASSPVGTVLAGSGTATLTMRAASGLLAVKVTETNIGHRYLWIKASGHSRCYIRSVLGVLELQFT